MPHSMRKEFLVYLRGRLKDLGSVPFKSDHGIKASQAAAYAKAIESTLPWLRSGRLAISFSPTDFPDLDATALEDAQSLINTYEEIGKKEQEGILLDHDDVKSATEALKKLGSIFHIALSKMEP